MRKWFSTIHILLIILVMLPGGVPAQNVSLTRQIKAYKYEIEKDMTRTMDSMLGKVMRNDQFWTLLEVTIDRAKLISDYKRMNSKNTSKPKKVKKYESLPGLNLDEKGTWVNTENTEDKVVVVGGNSADLTKSFVLSYVRSVNIEVATNSKQSRKAQRTLKKLILEHFKGLNVPVNLKFNERKMKNLELTEDDIKNGAEAPALEKVNIDHEGMAVSFKDKLVTPTIEMFKTEWLPMILLGIGAIVGMFLVTIVIGAYIFMNTMKKNSAEMAKLLKSIPESLSSISISMPPSMEMDQSEMKEESVETSENAWSEYSVLMDKIKKDIMSSKTVAKNILEKLVKGKNFDHLAVLVESVGSAITVALPAETLVEFNFYLRTRSLSKDDVGVKLKMAKELYDMIWKGSLDNENLLFEEVKTKIGSLPNSKLEGIVSKCDSKELPVIVDLLPARVLAEFVKKNTLTPESIAQASVQPVTPESIVSLQKKISSVGVGIDGSNVGSKLDQIGKYIDVEMEKRLFMSAGLPISLTTSELVRKKTNLAQKFLDDLSLDDICSLSAVLDDDTIKQLHEGMSEVMKKRISSRKIVRSEHSFALKSKLVEYLKSETSPEEINERSISYQRLEAQREDYKNEMIKTHKSKAKQANPRNENVRQLNRDVPPIPGKKAA